MKRRDTYAVGSTVFFLVAVFFVVAFLATVVFLVVIGKVDACNGDAVLAAASVRTHSGMRFVRADFCCVTLKFTLSDTRGCLQCWQPCWQPIPHRSADRSCAGRAG